MHTLSIRSTEAFEGARAKLAEFIGARDVAEVIFTRNATEAINLVARSWGSANIGAGDEILLTLMEHHSNLVPWQLLAEKVGAKLRFVGLTPEGTLDRAEFERLLSARTRLVAMCHVSNVLGCVNPVEWVAERAHAVGAKVLIDACQSLPHMSVDVEQLGADWVVASSHKMCGPTGIGFLWGRAELLRAAPPFLGGGEMIDDVGLEHSTYADIPHKLEAGTPAFAEAVALGAACDFLSELGMDAVREQEHVLTEHLWRRVAELPGAVLYGPPPSLAPDRAALVSFNVEGCHPNDLATLVDQECGVAMRAGHHCCQPLHRELGVAASARLSAYFYNTVAEIDVAAAALRDAIAMLKGDAGELDLFAAAEAETPCWGSGVGPPTVLEALSERGLVEKTTWAEGADCPLADPAARVRVCVAFDPTAGSLRFGDLPGLVLLKWCQLYGHTPVCLLRAAGACAESALEDSMRNKQGLQSCFGQVLDLGGGAPAIVVDNLEWFEGVSVPDFLFKVGSRVCVRSLLEQASASSAPGPSLAELADPVLRAWDFVQLRERHSVAVQAGDSGQWPAMLTGLELASAALEPESEGPESVYGCLKLALLPAGGLEPGAEHGEGSDAESRRQLAPCLPDGLHQWLLGVHDREVPALLRQLTLMPIGEVEALVGSMDDAAYVPGSAQCRLAEESTRLVFGEQGLELAKSTAAAGASTVRNLLLDGAPPAAAM